MLDRDFVFDPALLQDPGKNWLAQFCRTNPVLLHALREDVGGGLEVDAGVDLDRATEAKVRTAGSVPVDRYFYCHVDQLVRGGTWRSKHKVTDQIHWNIFKYKYIRSFSNTITNKAFIDGRPSLAMTLMLYESLNKFLNPEHIRERPNHRLLSPKRHCKRAINRSALWRYFTGSRAAQRKNLSLLHLISASLRFCELIS